MLRLGWISSGVELNRWESGGSLQRSNQTGCTHDDVWASRVDLSEFANQMRRSVSSVQAMRLQLREQKDSITMWAPPCPKTTNPIRLRMYDLSTTKWFEWVVVGVIVLNTMALMVVHYQMDSDLEAALEIINLVCTPRPVWKTHELGYRSA